MDNHRIIQVEEKVPLSFWYRSSLQHISAMFGASVLVPSIFHISPAIVLLFMNGIGTLLFIFVTKGKAPAYLEFQLCVPGARRHRDRKIRL